MKINLEKIKEYNDKKLIKTQKHNTANLLIHNYTPKCQFGRHWDKYTMMCRGLITDLEGNVKAKPFEKFFNYGEIIRIPEAEEVVRLDLRKEYIHHLEESYEIYEKLDGSLGIMYWVDGIPYIATRGSFHSDIAIKATKMLHYGIMNNYGDSDNIRVQAAIGTFRSSWTYLWEIIYPENRIVVDYGNKSELRLIGVIDTKTGKDAVVVSTLGDSPGQAGFQAAQRYQHARLEKLKEENIKNKEGFVIKFESGFRMKIKFEEYTKLHRIMTSISSRGIWEWIREGRTLEELIHNVDIPDEFYDWMKSTVRDIEYHYQEIETQARKDFERIIERKELNDKEFAKEALKCENSWLVFAMSKNHNYTEKLWKSVEPEYELPFSNKSDNDSGQAHTQQITYGIFAESNFNK